MSVSLYKKCFNECKSLIKEHLYDEAMNCSHRLLDIYSTSDRSDELTNVFEGSEAFFLNASNGILHLTYLNRLMGLYEENGDIENQIKTMYEVAADYIEATEYTIARSILSRGIALALKNNLEARACDFYNGMGRIENANKNPQTALDYFLKAYNLASEVGYLEGRRFAHNIGYTQKKLKRYDISIKYFKIAIDFMCSKSNPSYCANSYNELGETYMLNKDYETAEKTLSIAYELCVESGSLYFLRENYLFFSQLYEAKGLTNKALEYYKAFHELHLKIAKVNNKNNLKNFAYEKTLQKSKQENEFIRLKNLELDNYIKELDKTNEALQVSMAETLALQESMIQTEKHAAFNRILMGIAHKINTSIGNIVDATTHIEKKIETLYDDFHRGKLSKKSMKSFYDGVKLNMTLIQNSYIQMKEFTEQMKHSTIPEGEDCSLETILNRCKKHFHDSIRKYSCDVIFDLEDGLSIVKGTPIIEQVLMRLFENAFQYAFVNHINNVIEICSSVDQEQILEITFKDNGNGISKEALPYIFDPFFSLEMGLEGGSGLGLYIAFKVINDMLKGQLTCDSQLGNGTVFTVRIPLKVSEISRMNSA